MKNKDKEEIVQSHENEFYMVIEYTEREDNGESNNPKTSCSAQLQWPKVALSPRESKFTGGDVRVGHSLTDDMRKINKGNIRININPFIGAERAIRLLLSAANAIANDPEPVIQSYEATLALTEEAKNLIKSFGLFGEDSKLL